MAGSPAVALVDRPDAVRAALSPIRPACSRACADRRRPRGGGRDGPGAAARELPPAGARSRGPPDLVEERQRRGCVERILVARARAFVVDPAVIRPRRQPRRRAAGSLRRRRISSPPPATWSARDAHAGERRRATGRGSSPSPSTPRSAFATPADFERFSSQLAAQVARLAAMFNHPPAGALSRRRSADIPRQRLLQGVEHEHVREGSSSKIVVAASPEAVWRALREPAEIAAGSAGRPAAGGGDRPDLRGRRGGHRRGPAPRAFPMPATSSSSSLAVRRRWCGVVRAAPAGTDWDGIYDEIVEGWRTFVQQLAFVFAAHAGDARRTLYLSGRTREGGPRPPAAIGLTAIRAARAIRIALSSAPGDTLTGTVWFAPRIRSASRSTKWGRGC